jgi:hypothetical protein
MTTYSLYNGQVQLDFDPEVHQYKIGDRIIPNMTNITKVCANNGSALLGWGMKLASEKFLELVKPNTKYDEIALIDLAKQIKSSALSSRDRSGDIGTMLHENVERFLTDGAETEIHNPEVLNAYTQFKNWFATESFEVINLEKKVYYKDNKYEFCGTTDCLAKDKDGYVVMDWKTSKSANYFNYRLQVVGYSIALERELGIKINKAKILCFPKTGKYKIVTVDVSETIREAFFACVKLYQSIEGEK